MRLLVVALVYKQFLDPERAHWEFGYEIGRVARAIVAGHGFANPYWADTGPTAILTPVFPYFFAAVFWIFGVSTKASALVILTLNCLVSALTCVPMYFVARKCFAARTWLVRNYRTFHQPVFLKDNFWMEVCAGNIGNALHWWNGEVHPSGSTEEGRK